MARPPCSVGASLDDDTSSEGPGSSTLVALPSPEGPGSLIFIFFCCVLDLCFIIKCEYNTLIEIIFSFEKKTIKQGTNFALRYWYGCGRMSCFRQCHVGSVDCSHIGNHKDGVFTGVANSWSWNNVSIG